MTSHVFSVYDAKSEAYLPPFTASTYGIAERLFSDLVGEPGHQFNKHPADYTLYVIGTYDSATAHMETVALTPLITGLAATGGPIAVQ